MGVDLSRSMTQKLSIMISTVHTLVAVLDIEDGSKMIKKSQIIMGVPSSIYPIYTTSPCTYTYSIHSAGPTSHFFAPRGIIRSWVEFQPHTAFSNPVRVYHKSSAPSNAR